VRVRSEARRAVIATERVEETADADAAHVVNLGRRKLEATLAAIPDALITLDADGRIEYVNAAAEALTGVRVERGRGVHVSALLHIFDDEGSSFELPADLAGEAVRRGLGHVSTREGTTDVAYVASRIDRGGTVLMLRDITAEHRLALRLSFEALHDPLTGLPNRRAFLERLESALRGARERGEHHAVAFMDLDHFKLVNDRFGHAAGDRVLVEIARVMGRAVRAVDVLARLGGDEFVLLLANCRLADAERVTEKVRAAVCAHRVAHAGEQLGVGISIGLARIDAAAGSADEVIAAADAACYAAKELRHRGRE
jgi:diguanylate cyclase (GGDEF)-like protein/PAS domain S-box-containing protein